MLLALLGWSILAQAPDEDSLLISNKTLTVPTNKAVENSKTYRSKTDIMSTAVLSQPKEAEDLYVVNCKPLRENEEDELDEMLEDYDKYLSEAKLIAKPLMESTDLDSQLVLAFLTNITDSTERIDILTSILKTEPNNHLANWDLLTVCAYYIESGYEQCSEKMINNAKTSIIKILQLGYLF